MGQNMLRVLETHTRTLQARLDTKIKRVRLSRGPREMSCKPCMKTYEFPPIADQSTAPQQLPGRSPTRLTAGFRSVHRQPHAVRRQPQLRAYLDLAPNAREPQCAHVVPTNGKLSAQSCSAYNHPGAPRVSGGGGKGLSELQICKRHFGRFMAPCVSKLWQDPV